MPRLDNNGRPVQKPKETDTYVIARLDPQTRLVLGFVGAVGYADMFQLDRPGDPEPLFIKLRSGKRLKKFTKTEAEVFIDNLEQGDLFRGAVGARCFIYKMILARQYQKEL